MEWTKEFYSKQNQWSGVYTCAVHSAHHHNARKAAVAFGNLPHRLLDLGTGGGQNAAALAELGCSVSALELLPELCDFARTHQIENPNGALEVIQADFYAYQPEELFDALTYWDGFGIGSDADQSRLLRLAAGWLKPQGMALIEVYTPWYWAAEAGTKRGFGKACFEYDFDARGCRMLNTWYLKHKPEQFVTQSLRCYSSADLSLLLSSSGSGLRLVEVFPGGALDSQTGKWVEEVPLKDSMQFLAKLVKE